jgi:molybdopterin-guanine dinucleotide biosynthesis protein A
MGVADKTELRVGGRPLLAVARDALIRAGRTVVVGPHGDLVEDPPGGGPLAAIAAGLTRIEAPVVVVLAADLPFVTVDAVETLVHRASAMAVDDHDQAQYLLAAYRTDELRGALPDLPVGRSLRSVIDALAPTRVVVGGSPPPWWDCDTPEDLARARMWI